MGGGRVWVTSSLVDPKNSTASTRIFLPLYASNKHIWLTLLLILHENDNALRNYPRKISTWGIHTISLLLQSNKLSPTTEKKKKTITENKQNLERKHVFLFSKRNSCHLKYEKQILQELPPSLRAQSLPVPKWHRYTVLIVYTLLFFSFYFVSFLLLLQKVSSFSFLMAPLEKVYNFLSGDSDLRPQCS